MPVYNHRGYWESTAALCWEMMDLCAKESDDYRYADAVLHALHNAGFKVYDHKQEYSNDTGNRQ